MYSIFYENKKIAFRTMNKNFAISTIKLTECWINTQTTPVEFQIQASYFLS